MTIRKSTLAGLGLAVPEGWEIKIQKAPVFAQNLNTGEKTLVEELFDVEYSEWWEKELPFDPAKGTQDIIKYLGIQAPGELTIKDNKVIWKWRGTLNQVCNMMVGEFLGAADIGDITIRDLLIYAGVGRQRAEQFVEKSSIKSC